MKTMHKLAICIFILFLLFAVITAMIHDYKDNTNAENLTTLCTLLSCITISLGIVDFLAGMGFFMIRKKE